jgi:spermidine synthase
MGGAVGALTPLLLLPLLGWLASIQLVACVGLLVGAAALWLSRWVAPPKADETSKPALVMPPAKWLLAYAGIGAAALMLEIGWTRLFGMVLLRTEYVLAVILAVFLVGIGLGSLVARHLLRPLWFSVLPIVASGFAVLSLWLLPTVSAWVEAQQFASLWSALLQQGAVIATLTLPVTLVFGAWLPLLSVKVGDRYQAGAWLYGANSLGAALGAMLAGFVFIPAMGTHGTLIVAALLLLVLGLAWAQVRWTWLAVPLLGIVAVPVAHMPSVAALLPKTYHDASNIYVHEDAISITHVVKQANGQRQLLTDLHRMDASSEPTAVAVQMNQARLPLLMQPKPQRVLFLGLGTAISAAGSLPFPIQQRTAVELSQGAIVAARDYFSAVNHAVAEKLHIVRDDARHFLLSDRHAYDVIIGDLFHPDLVGRSALLSRQQFQRARHRLAPGGIFVQWLALNQFDVNSLQVVLRTFRSVFPHAVMFVDAFRLAMVGPKGGELRAETMLASLDGVAAPNRDDATGGEGVWTWLGRYWGRIPESRGPVQDEWAPVIEYRLPRARYNGDLDISRLLAWLLSQRPHVRLAAHDLQVAADDYEHFERAYVATELAQRSWVAMLRDQAAEGQRLLPLAYEANPKDRWIGFAIADDVLADRAVAEAKGLSEKAVLEKVLSIRPDHTEALRRLWHLAQAAGDGVAAARYRARLTSLSPFDSALQETQ